MVNKLATTSNALAGIQAQRDKDLMASDKEKAAGFGRMVEIIFGSKAKIKKGAAEGDVSGGEGVVGANGTNIHVANMNIKVKAEVNEDPARIAKGFEEVVDTLLRNTTQADRPQFALQGS